jgi:hypothetical protein
MDYELKYKKYKHKYLGLKNNQIGGKKPNNIFIQNEKMLLNKNIEVLSKKNIGFKR